MPSWYNNNLTVTADRATVDTIIAAHIDEDGDIDFNTVAPYPAECSEADRRLTESGSHEQTFSDEGFQWCIANWGAQWNASSTWVSRVSGSELVMSFRTAGAPPLPIVEKLAFRYPEASFKMYYKDDTSVSRIGVVEYVDGELTDNWSGTLDIKKLEKEVAEFESQLEQELEALESA